MSVPVSRFFLACLLVTSAATSAAAGRLAGTIRNGTTGAPGSGLEVVLIQLQGGMQAVATTKADPQGRYEFDRPEIGQRPLLVRVNYHGVNYHQTLPPGRDSADLEIFEPTTDPGVLQVASRTIVVQPNGFVLLVGEEYSVHNHSKPPAAFYNASGTFEFRIPEGGELAQVSAWGPSGMPLVQGTIERGKNHYAIAFPLRPGENGVRLSYQLPYGANQATLRAWSPYAAQRVLLVAPPTMQVAGEGFQATGTEQGWNVYAHDAVAAGSTFEFSVSGTAPPPSAAEPQESPAPESGQPVRALPGRLDNVKWVLIGGLVALFALGVIFVWRQPKREAVSRAAAALDREVRHGLDDIKETLFRLELRKQAGTISEEEYAHERSRAEKLLRDLVKG